MTPTMEDHAEDSQFGDRMLVYSQRLSTHVIEVFVDTTSYGGTGYEWCHWTSTAVGTAARYRKAQIPNRGEGQFCWADVLHVRCNGEP